MTTQELYRVSGVVKGGAGQPRPVDVWVAATTGLREVVILADQAVQPQLYHPHEWVDWTGVQRVGTVHTARPASPEEPF